jgi:cytochrome b6-f complex iron-sulfur subunit
MKTTRKEFFVKSAQGMAIMSLPVLFSSFLESCNTITTSPNMSASPLPALQGTTSNGTVTVAINSSSPLAKTGSAGIVNYSSGSILVDHPSVNVYNAFTSICTHQGCLINSFDSGSNQFICLCHDSRFDINGKVAQGPASSPLQQFQTQFTNNQLIITL